MVLATLTVDWITVAAAYHAEARIPRRFTVLPQQLRITEEDPAGGNYRISLNRGPDEAVTVFVGGVEGSDLTVRPSQVMFTPDDWEEARTVTVTAGADDDGSLDQVQLRHRAVGSGLENLFVPGLLVVVADNDHRGLDLNPSELTVREEDAEGAAYTVALKTEPKREVTIVVGGAAGTDLVLGRRSLTFDATNWNVPQTVTVSARGDADALDEEVKLVHRANGRYLLGATVEVLVTVVDDDEPSTAVEIRTDTVSVDEGGGARTVADHLFAAVEERLAGARDLDARLRLGGQEVSRSWDDHAAAEDPVEALRRRVRGEEGSGRSASMTMQEFLDRSAYAVKFGDGSGDGGLASMWGRGVLAVDAREGAVSLDGEVVTGMLGGDYASGRWRAGLALFHSEGDGTFRMDAGAVDVSSSLSGIYPYVGYEVDRNLLVWAGAGYGAGRLGIPQHTGQQYKTDMEMIMTAAGVRGQLVPRAGLEGMGPILTLSMEVGLRHDTGDAERGLGLDVGAGLDWSDPARGAARTRRHAGRRGALVERSSATSGWPVPSLVWYRPPYFTA